MSDNDFRIGIDSSQVHSATSALDSFKTAAHGAGDATKDTQDRFSGLTREMQQMLQQQREANAMLTQIAQSTRGANAALSEHHDHITQITSAVTAASTAYLAFSTHAQKAGDTLNQAFGPQAAANAQRVASSIENLNAQLQRTAQMQTPSFGQMLQGSTAPIAGANAVAGVFGSNPQMQQINDQIAALTTALTLRTNIDTGTLLQGISSAGRVGIGGDQATQLLSRMNQILNGYSPEDLAARRTLTSYGVNSGGDANTVLTQALQALSARAPSYARNQAAAQIFGPNFDPALLLQSNVEGLTPQGAEGRYELSQQSEAQSIQAQINTLVEQQNRILKDPNRTVFGNDVNPRGFGPNNPLSFIPGSAALYRYGQDFGESFNPNGVYGRTREALSQQQGLNWLNLESGPGSFLSRLNDFGNNVTSTGWKQIQNFANPFVGNAFGNIDLGVPSMPASSAPTPLSQDLITSFQQLLISAGRTTPEALQGRLTRIQQQGAGLVAEAEKHDPEEAVRMQKELAEATTILTKRFERLSDPIGQITERMTQENQILALPQNQQAYARFIQGQERQNMDQFGKPLTDTQRAGLSLVFQEHGNRQSENELADTQHAAEYQKQLADAYHEGGAAIQQVIAREKEYQEALKTNADAAHQAANAAADVALSWDKSFTDIQKTLAQGQLQVTASGNLATAAPGGPLALRQAQIENEVQAKFRGPDGLLTAATTPDQITAALNAEDEYRKQLQAVQANQGQQTLATGRFNYGQTMTTLNSALGTTANPGGNASIQQGLNFFTSNGYTPEQAAGIVGRLAAESGGGTWLNPNAVNGDSGAYGIDQALGPRKPAMLATGGDLQAQLEQVLKELQTTEAAANSAIKAQNTPYGVGMAMERFERANNPRFTQIGATDAQRIYQQYYGNGTAPGAGTVQTAMAQQTATQTLQAAGVNPTGSALQQQTAQVLNENFAKLAESTKEQLDADAQLLPLQQARAEAEKQGPAAVAAFDDALKIATETNKLAATASGDTKDKLTQLSQAIAANVSAQRQVANTAAVNQIVRQQQLGVSNTNAQIAAFENGGTNAMNIVAASQPIAAQLSQYMPQDQANQMAQQMALAAKSAEDMKAALTDASQEIATTMKSAIGDVVNGITEGIGKAHGLRYAMMNEGLNISKLGLNMFLTKPLDTLADNLASGNGFSFNVGNSGMSYTDALLKGFGKLFSGGSSTNNSGSSTSSATAIGDIGNGAATGLTGSSGTGGDSDPIKGIGSNNPGGGSNLGSSILSGLLGKSSMIGKALGLGDNTSSGSTYTPGMLSSGDSGNGLTGGTGNGTGGFSLFSPGTWFDSGSGGGAGDLGASAFHTGGLVGAYGYGTPRQVPAWVFYGAPRYHEGGLAADEVPIIAQKGERVLTADQNAQYTAQQSRLASGDVHVTQNIYTQDAHSFRASSDQVAQSALTAHARAMRNT